MSDQKNAPRKGRQAKHHNPGAYRLKVGATPVTMTASKADGWVYVTIGKNKPIRTRSFGSQAAAMDVIRRHIAPRLRQGDMAPLLALTYNR